MATALLAVSACSSSGSDGPSGSPAPPSSPATGATSAQSPSASPTGSATATASPQKEPTFSAADITVRTVTRRGSEVLVEVTAPPETTFAIGEKAPGVTCRIDDTTGTTPVTYRLTCPQPGPRLLSSIHYGDFEYGFESALPPVAASTG